MFAYEYVIKSDINKKTSIHRKTYYNFLFSYHSGWLLFSKENIGEYLCNILDFYGNRLLKKKKINRKNTILEKTAFQYNTRKTKQNIIV